MVEDEQVELVNKLAVVTGASRGIGRALSFRLAGHGCGLLLTALEGDELTALAEELGRSHVQVATMPADLTDPESRRHLLDWILERETPPDIVVNNAGMGGRFGRFEDLELSGLERTIAVNVSAFVHLTRELLPVLQGRSQAKVVNISSGIARLPYPGLAVYGATKAFVSSLSESLSCELHGTSVDVLCFHPGFTETSFMQSSAMDMRRIPRILLHTPQQIAAQIVKAIERDRTWDYSDFATRFLTCVGALAPHWLKIPVFKDLFWELPSKEQNSPETTPISPP